MGGEIAPTLIRETVIRTPSLWEKKNAARSQRGVWDGVGLHEEGEKQRGKSHFTGNAGGIKC